MRHLLKELWESSPDNAHTYLLLRACGVSARDAYASSVVAVTHGLGEQELLYGYHPALMEAL